MAKKKGGLGKGLNAIFMENESEDSNSTVTLKISEIEPNRAQPRREFDEKALAELADSISQHGVLQPLLVRPLLDGGYQIVAGERRWRASRMAGLTEVPVVIRELSDGETMELALIENLQREDLTPVEEALGYQQLMDKYSLTQDEVSRAVEIPAGGRKRAAAVKSAGRGAVACWKWKNQRGARKDAAFIQRPGRAGQGGAPCKHTGYLCQELERLAKGQTRPRRKRRLDCRKRSFPIMKR